MIHPDSYLRGLAAGLVVATLLIAGPAQAVPLPTVPLAAEQAQRHMNMMHFRLKRFHNDARNSLVTTLELPYFSEYFSLPESRGNRYDSLGRIELSAEQERLRRELESWILTLHDRFPIAESCLIDRTGQEHLRVSSGKVEKPLHFSSNEHGAPFFTQAMEIAKGEAGISRPYLSHDALEWVVAFVSPVVLPDGSRPGFFHYEVPLAAYQRIITTRDYQFGDKSRGTADHDEEGRMFIFDEAGLVITDNRQELRYRIHDERDPEKHDHLPDYLPAQTLADYLPDVSSIHPSRAFLDAIEKMRHLERGNLTLRIDERDYVLAFVRIPELEWYLVHMDPVGGPGFWHRH